LLQAGAFTTQLLGAVGLIPDAGLSQLQFDLCQALFLVSIVKDTP
jgi:hypothetical protein